MDGRIGTQTGAEGVCVCGGGVRHRREEVSRSEMRERGHGFLQVWKGCVLKVRPPVLDAFGLGVWAV